MVHLTLAVGDFMMMLIGSALWAAAGVALWAVAAIGLCGGAVALARRWRRGR